HRRGDRPDPSFSGMLVFQKKSCLLQIVIVQKLLQAVHRPIGNVLLVQQLMPLGSGTLAELLRDDGVELIIVVHASAGGAEPWILDQIGTAEGGQDALPLLVIHGKNADVTVLCPVRPAVLRQQANVTNSAVQRWLESRPPQMLQI